MVKRPPCRARFAARALTPNPPLAGDGGDEMPNYTWLIISALGLVQVILCLMMMKCAP
jgi:hypothetical protein